MGDHVSQRTLAEIGADLDTDKTLSMGYLENYERHMGHLRDAPVRLLELGVFHGGSLLMWNEYFAQGEITGLDLQPNPLAEMPPRVKFYQGSQDDAALLNRVGSECAPQGFDIIIDDASHIGTLTRASFLNLFDRHLKPGGLYVIEDWGTGYWHNWPDGADYKAVPPAPTAAGQRTFTQRVAGRLSREFAKFANFPPAPSAPQAVDPNFVAHNHGLVGFIKELVDEVAWRDITFDGRGNASLPSRASAIRSMMICHGQVFLVKA